MSIFKNMKKHLENSGDRSLLLLLLQTRGEVDRKTSKN